MEECVFCKIAKGEIPCQKTFESENFIGILDLHPYTEGHTLIISKKHFENFLELPNEFSEELTNSIKKVAKDLFFNGKAEGFNILQNNGIVAQQEIPHLHFHIVPRKKDNSKNFKFK
jgi:histidine triad (HIT) family protein